MCTEVLPAVAIPCFLHYLVLGCTLQQYLSTNSEHAHTGAGQASATSLLKPSSHTTIGRRRQSDSDNHCRHIVQHSHLYCPQILLPATTNGLQLWRQLIITVSQTLLHTNHLLCTQTRQATTRPGLTVANCGPTAEDIPCYLCSYQGHSQTQLTSAT